MGKRLKQQVRGKGTPRYKFPSHRAKARVKYRNYDDIERTSMLKGEIIAFIDDPARTAPLAVVRFENGEEMPIIAPEGIAVGDEIEVGAQAKPKLGSIMPLYAIPDGYYLYNLEKKPGDGGKFIRAAGTYGIILSRDDSYVYVKMPNKKILALNPECRAQIGVVAGGGFKEKPLLKAGHAYYKHKAKNRLWPKVRGVKMSPYDHPFGGKQHHAGRSTAVARNASPGQKVGHIAPRRLGRKSKKG